MSGVQPHTVYLVEDEPNLADLLASYLERAGYRVRSFHSGEEALRVLEQEPPHLWILDIMLPDVDGYELLRQIRSQSDVPVIFISARDQDIDRIIGLELGSDDYLAKPFLPRELVIRVQKLLARTYGKDASSGSTSSVGDWLQAGPYRVSVGARLVKRGDETIDLTPKEFDLLVCLLRHRGQALHREQILRTVWGADYVGSDRAVDDLVKRVRKKLPNVPLETVYGYGYRLTE